MVWMYALVSERSRHKFRLRMSSSGDEVWMDMPSSLMFTISQRFSAMPAEVPFKLTYAGVWTLWRTRQRRSRAVGFSSWLFSAGLVPVGYIQKSCTSYSRREGKRADSKAGSVRLVTFRRKNAVSEATL